MGIVELKGSNVGVTCKSRENVLELFGKFRNHEKIEYVKLYESDKVHVTLGWVPTPFPQELIQKRFKGDYGEILKITHKKDRKGLFSGTRIMVMNASNLKKKPIPSYVYIAGYEFFVTYEGQMSTCRYCGQPNHKQLDCPRRKEDYPQPPIINGNRQKGKHADPPAEKNNAIRLRLCELRTLHNSNNRKVQT